MTAPKDLDCKTASAVQSDVKMSLGTMVHYLRKHVLQHLRPRTVSILTAVQKLQGLPLERQPQGQAFSMRSSQTAISGSLLRGNRQAASALQQQRHSEGVHACMGMSCRGDTLKLETGTHQHINGYTSGCHLTSGL